MHVIKIVPPSRPQTASIRSYGILAGALIALSGALSPTMAGTFFIGPTGDYPTIKAGAASLVPFQEDHTFYVNVPLAGYKDPMDLTTAGFNGHTLTVYPILTTESSASYYVDEDVEYRLGDDNQFESAIEYVDAGAFTARKVKTQYSDPSDAEYYIKNNQGSTVALMSEGGFPLGEYYEYQAYGTQSKEQFTSITPITHSYTGKELDQLGEPSGDDGQGLYHFGARYYDSDIGLWMGVDPDLETNNPYAFAADNPIAFTDANGKSVYTKAGKIIFKVIKTGDAASAFADNVQDACILFSANATLGGRVLAGLSLASEFLPVSVGDLKDGYKVAKFIGKKLDKADDVVKVTAKAESKLVSSKKYAKPSGFRADVKDKVWENAKEASTGRVRDPVTGRFMAKDKPWDMGHKPGFEFKKHQASAEARGIERKQFRDEHNDPSHYRPELPSSNRSHKGEAPADIYFGP